VCKLKGLKGDESVMIPKSNAQDLMLKEEVVKAVKDGQFHIYPVSSIDEGIQILTGVKAGERTKKGSFEPDTVNDKVDGRLKKMAESLTRFGEAPARERLHPKRSKEE
jgi:predicted ATP-dependent protease